MNLNTRPSRLFQHRLYGLLWLSVGLTLILWAHLTRLQWLDHAHYQTLAKHNYLSTLAKAPKRGLIYDRHLHIIADNQAVLELDILHHTTATEAALKRLSTWLPQLKIPAHIPKHIRHPWPLKVGLSPEEEYVFMCTNTSFQP